LSTKLEKCWTISLAFDTTDTRNASRPILSLWEWLLDVLGFGLEFFVFGFGPKSLSLVLNSKSLPNTKCCYLPLTWTISWPRLSTHRSWGPTARRRPSLVSTRQVNTIDAPSGFTNDSSSGMIRSRRDDDSSPDKPHYTLHTLNHFLSDWCTSQTSLPNHGSQGKKALASRQFQILLVLAERSAIWLEIFIS